MTLEKINERQQIAKSADDLLDASKDFCAAYMKDVKNELTLNRTTNAAMKLFRELALSVRNLQDVAGFNSCTNPIIGKKVTGLSDEKVKSSLTNSCLPAEKYEDVKIRDVMNRFAHSVENSYGMRVSDEGHFIIIAHKDKKSRINILLEFKVSDFCDGCHLVAQA